MPDSFNVPRYLTALHPKRVPHYFTDIVIIGGGLAGLRAAIEVDESQSVVVVTKDRIQESNSSYAQGGIAGVLDPDDRFEDHIRDTLDAGGDLCNQKIVELVIREAPERIQELIQWGTKFDENSEGLLLGKEGGHSRNRIVHALGDSTGKEVMRAITHWTRRFPNVQLWQQAFTIDLIVHEGRCRGIIVWNPHHGKMILWAKQTIVCTGGTGQVYRETTNPSVATGDGHAFAYRAGAEMRDMEFMQFHPTVLYIAGSSRTLITEAMRGEGAKLVDANGERFMQQYDNREELAPRDIVSKSIVAQMEKTRYPNVFLDVSHLEPQFVRKRFPGIAAACLKFGIDITKDQIPVRPGAHYMIGGIRVDADGRTSIPALWAAGEVTSSGLHGANRLASNSLLEGLVFGAHCGRGASREAAKINDDFEVVPIANSAASEPTEPLDLIDIRNSLKSLMWRDAGVIREKSRMEAAINSIDNWCRYVLPRQFSDPAGWELQNMLVVSRLIIQSALMREESRGVHQRTDFVNKDNVHWQRHISWTQQDNMTMR